MPYVNLKWSTDLFFKSEFIKLIKENLTKCFHEMRVDWENSFAEHIFGKGQRTCILQFNNKKTNNSMKKYQRLHKGRNICGQ